LSSCQIPPYEGVYTHSAPHKFQKQTHPFGLYSVGGKTEAGSLTDTSLELDSDAFAKSRGSCFNVGLRIGGRDLYLSIGVHRGFLLSLLPMNHKFAKTLLNLLDA
jgi:hypothetical protein